MNKRQENIIENLRKDILLNDGLGERFVGEHEYKRFEIEETEFGSVSLLSVVGHKKDENTMGELMCRTRRHIFISPRGGIKIANASMKGNRRHRSLRNWPQGYWNAIHCLTT